MSMSECPLEKRGTGLPSIMAGCEGACHCRFAMEWLVHRLIDAGRRDHNAIQQWVAKNGLPPLAKVLAIYTAQESAEKRVQVISMILKPNNVTFTPREKALWELSPNHQLSKNRMLKFSEISPIWRHSDPEKTCWRIEQDKLLAIRQTPTVRFKNLLADSTSESTVFIRQEAVNNFMASNLGIDWLTDERVVLMANEIADYLAKPPALVEHEYRYPSDYLTKLFLLADRLGTKFGQLAPEQKTAIANRLVGSRGCPWNWAISGCFWSYVTNWKSAPMYLYEWYYRLRALPTIN